LGFEFLVPGIRLPSILGHIRAVLLIRTHPPSAARNLSRAACSIRIVKAARSQIQAVDGPMVIPTLMVRTSTRMVAVFLPFSGARRVSKYGSLNAMGSPRISSLVTQTQIPGPFPLLSYPTPNATSRRTLRLRKLSLTSRSVAGQTAALARSLATNR